MAFDAAYEFDAPQFYNFGRTSLGCSQASAWFDQQEHPVLRSPLAEVTSKVLCTADNGKKTGPATAANTSQPKKSNIVTSWGAASTGKRVRIEESVPKAAASAAPASASKSKAREAAVPVRLDPPVTRSATKKKLARQLEGDETEPTSEQRPPRFNLEATVTEAIAQPAPTIAPAAAPAVAASAFYTAAAVPLAASACDAAGGKRIRKQWNRCADAGAAPAAADVDMDPPPASGSLAHAQEECEEVEKEEEDVASWGARAAGGLGGSDRPAVSVPPRKLRSKSAHGGHDGSKGGKRSMGVPVTKTQVGPSAGFLRPIGIVKHQTRATAATVKGTGSSGHVGRDPLKMKKVLAPHKVVAARSTKALTLPDDFELQTSRRARPDEHASDGNKTPFKSLVSKVQEFQNRTPTRFRTRPGPAPEHKPLTMTDAKDPVLWTTTRTRPSTYKGREETELEQMEANQFRAAAINEFVPKTVRKAPATGGGGMGPSTCGGPTEMLPFHFVTDDRAEYKRHREEAQRQQREREEAAEKLRSGFKAHPVNRHILDGPVGLPGRQHLSCTVPKSPYLRTKLRGYSEAPLETAKQDSFKALPMPVFLDIPKGVCVQREPAALTQPQPFHLSTEARGKYYTEALKKQVLEEEAAAEARKWKAQPVAAHNDKVVYVPRPEPKELTEPQPFNLRSENRHQHYVQVFSKEIEMREEVERAEAAFKARALPRTHLAPYVIAQESDRPLTVPLDVKLTTESRAAERERFDRDVGEKMRQTEAEKAVMDAERAKEEQRERLAIRRAARFKARPAPDFSKQVSTAPPLQSKPLTQAITPKLGKRRRGPEA